MRVGRSTPRANAGAAIDVLLLRTRPAWTIAVLRILFGLVLLAWTVTMMFDASAQLTPDGAVPPAFAHDGWRWFDLDTASSVWVTLVVLAIGAVAITIGWKPTGWLLFSFVLLVALQRRNPFLINSGDLILRNMALLLACCPTGAALSFDRWRAGESLGTAPLVAPWGLRLVQLQIVIVYLFAFWSKSGSGWRDGTAVSTTLRLTDLERFPSPGWMIDNVVVVAVLTWGTLAIELALATLLWVRRLRPVLIALGLLLHAFIDTFLLVGFFGLVMAVGLLSFADADWIGRQLERRWVRMA